jgi:hypothetical protein
MTTRKRTRSTPAPVKPAVTAPVVEEVVGEITEATAEPDVEVEETPVETVAEETIEVPTGKEPKVVELKDETAPNTLKEAQAPEIIQDQIRSKLNSRKNEETTDLFNPGASSAVAKAKMEDLAKEQGFQLTRGREIGARLLARAQANRR